MRAPVRGAMLRCLAGVCCGGQGGGATASAGAAPPDLAELSKPILRLGEDYVPAAGAEARALEEVGARLGMSPAPPGAASPIALVSADFKKNSSRLLVLIPSAGAQSGAWDVSLSGGVGALAPLLRWADANRFAVAAFTGQALSKSPGEAWEAVLKGSPARCASVLVAGGMLPTVEAAMAGLHPLLFSRFRNVCVAPGSSGPSQAVGPELQELRAHLANARLLLPAEWAEQDAFAAHQQLFEALLRREDFWSRNEIKKYAGFRNMKENDVPGLKRMPVDKRVERIGRDRGDDELARLLRKHEAAAAGQEEDEPGVD